MLKALKNGSLFRGKKPPLYSFSIIPRIPACLPSSKYGTVCSPKIPSSRRRRLKRKEKKKEWENKRKKITTKLAAITTLMLEWRKPRREFKRTKHPLIDQALINRRIFSCGEKTIRKWVLETLIKTITTTITTIIAKKRTRTIAVLITKTYLN